MVFGVKAYNKCCDGLGCFKPDPPFEHHTEPQCPEEMQISTRVYTRDNKEEDQGQAITRTTVPPAFKENKRTIFVVHGWMQSKDSTWLHTLKDALLKRGDFNVIVTGWAGASQDLFYWRSVSNTKVAGGEIALIAENLIKLGEIKREQTYCIGHSLGSHVCGFAGKRLKFGRITGLDPAGPLFDGYDEKAGLQKSDADFVDVIHTHGKNGVILNLGTMRPLGDVDFYPNGGGVQPGCINKFSQFDKQHRRPWDHPLLPTCSHMRAINYYTESVNSNQDKNCLFKARNQCPDKDNISQDKCPSCGNNCQTMGFDSETYEKRGLFFLETNNSEDFCRN